MLLAGQGHSVALVARRREALEEVARRCQGKAQVVVADVSQRANVRRVVEEVLAKWGRIDVWINNAPGPRVCHPS
jgi:NADP-dependent 3-hydroxy acid dehydrogenase YdfG